ASRGLRQRPCSSARPNPSIASESLDGCSYVGEDDFESGVRVPGAEVAVSVLQIGRPVDQYPFVRWAVQGALRLVTRKRRLDVVQLRSPYVGAESPAIARILVQLKPDHERVLFKPDVELHRLEESEHAMAVWRIQSDFRAHPTATRPSH